MQQEDKQKLWYVLFVKSGSEERIKKDLTKRFGEELDFFVPKKLMKERKKGKLKNVIRPLFPGYILINGNMTVEKYYKFKKIINIYFIIADEGRPLSIHDSEIQPILHLMNFGDSDVIGSSDIIIEGDHIFVQSGPLKAYEGNIKSVNHRKGRAKVSFILADREVIVELAVNVLSKS